MLDKHWVSQIIADELKQIEPSLNFDGMDNMVLNNCNQDFFLYSMWLEKQPKIASDKIEKGEQSVFIIKSDEANIIIEESEMIDVKDAVEIIKTFVKMWWKKYKERIKLTFEDPKFDVLGMKGRAVARGLFTMQELEEILTELTNSFIQYGEYCMPKLLANSLFMRTLAQSTKQIWTQQDKINLMNTLRREAKAIAHLSGHLLFVRPNKSSYSLREWRSDFGGNRII